MANSNKSAPNNKSEQKNSSILNGLLEFETDIIPVLKNFGQQLLKIVVIVGFNVLALTVHNYIINHIHFNDIADNQPQFHFNDEAIHQSPTGIAYEQPIPHY
jgi:hypothetical protein